MDKILISVNVNFGINVNSSVKKNGYISYIVIIYVILGQVFRLA